MKRGPIDQLGDPPLPDCLFCKRISLGMFLLQRDSALVFRDAFPVSPGHIHVLPRRHSENFFDLAPYERDSLWDTALEAVQYLEETHSPDGYNIGINIGPAAGQSIPHTSIHIIPRYSGDGDPAGVRWVRGGEKVEYKNEEKGCHFCTRLQEGDSLAVLLEDKTPISEGHCHVLPRRHEGSFLLLETEERDAIFDLLLEEVDRLGQKENGPDGFNLGINVGSAAGQGVSHTSVHLVPRRWDEGEEAAGLRWVRGGQSADVERHG